jgi:hypothetical protein
MSTLDPDLLQAFVAVADHRSFTRAASALDRTQSAVSMQVKRLEERLQAELFHRSTSSVDLSAAGEGLLGYARRILSLNAEAIGRVRAHGTDGRVRLGVMDDYGTLIVPPLLKDFTANYPLIPEDFERQQFPSAAQPYRKKVFGLSILPERLSEVRNERRPGSRYASLDNCRYEVSQAEAMMRREGIRWLSTTTQSIEEIATTIVQEVKPERLTY